MADYQKKSKYTLAEIDAYLGRARGVSNPNILDNWYFGNPVNQRQGRVVIPNTTYYSDNQLTTAAGTTSSYVTAYRYATGTASGVNYASFKLEDSDTAPTYYAAPANVVRGYTGAGYTFDRWMNETDPVVDTLENGLLKLTFSGVTTYMQKVQVPVGIQLTCSVLVENIDGDLYLLWQDTESYTDSHLLKLSPGMNTLTITTTKQNYRFSIYSSDSNAKTISIKAVKLELGTHQTLAHQDENGVWQLNEIPNYGDRLAGCQWYHFEFGPSHTLIAYDAYGVNSPVVYFPVQMRTVPSIKVYSKAGTENAISYWNGSSEVDFTDFYLESNENFVVLRSNGKLIPGGIYTVGKLIASAEL